jgi:hypothetical protein
MWDESDIVHAGFLYGRGERACVLDSAGLVEIRGEARCDRRDEELPFRVTLSHRIDLEV